MPDLPRDVRVLVFDPALPFDQLLISDAGVDTWHDHILITKSVLEHLPHVGEQPGKGILQVSGGMTIQVPVVTIGLKIGGLDIPQVTALVVDQGAHQLLFGRQIFAEIFKYKARAEPKDTYGQRPEAESAGDGLTVQLYPVTYPFSTKNFENFLRYQRELYNVLLISLGRIKAAGLDSAVVNSIVEEDEGIPDHLRLTIASVDEGSVLLALKSGCKDALKYLSSAFEKGASARLAQELAEARAAEVKAGISQETRDATALEIEAEKRKLSVQHIHETYKHYRADARGRLDFFNDLISESDDAQLQDQLRELKDRAILEMAKQMMVPVVRHVPGSRSTQRSAGLALPPPPDWSPGEEE